MILDRSKLVAAVRKVKHVKEHRTLYCIAPERIPVSIEDLQTVIADMCGLKITKELVGFEAEFVRGMTERYEKSVSIFVRSDQPDDWKRLVAAKELCHVLIDDKDDWSPRGHETIEAMVVDLSIGNDQKLGVSAGFLQSEGLAEVAAIEVLYPYEFRAHDHGESLAGKTTHGKLALYYRIPEYAVSQALDPRWLDVMKSIWDEISK